MQKNRKAELAAGISAALYALCCLWLTIRPAMVGDRWGFLAAIGAAILAVMTFKCFHAYALIGGVATLAVAEAVYVLRSVIFFLRGFGSWVDIPGFFAHIAVAAAWAVIALILLVDHLPAMQKYQDKRALLGKVLFAAVVAACGFSALRLLLVLGLSWVYRAPVASIGDILLIVLLFAMKASLFEKAPKAERKPAAASPDSVPSAAVSGVEKEFYVSLVSHVLLLVFTCGIWQLIWIYKATRFANTVKDEPARDPMVTLLLSCFVPFYMIYWTYKTAQRLDKIAAARGIPSELSSICLLLAIFVPFNPPILMQEKINQCVMAAAGGSNADAIATIKGLKELLDAGAITAEEYEAKKQQLLGL